MSKPWEIGTGAGDGSRRRGGNEREFGKLSIARTPHFHRVDVRIDDILQMGSQSRTICGGAAAWRANSLGDVEDDGREAVFVEIHFLMIGDLTDSTECVRAKDIPKVYRDAAHLTSAKFEGRSTIRAPPNSGVL